MQNKSKESFKVNSPRSEYENLLIHERNVETSTTNNTQKNPNEINRTWETVSTLNRPSVNSLPNITV